MKSRFVFLTLFFLLALAAGLSACGASPAASPEVTLASESALPDFVRAMPPQVKEAYRFAIANPDTLQKIPCYCGCGAMGHKSNYNCYIKNANTNGQIDFDDHATGCSICVDITRDVMRLQREGKALKDIRAYIDATYSKYGPPTNTGPVEGLANCKTGGICGVAAASGVEQINLKELSQITVPIPTQSQ
jgi:hypothetical protein